MPSYRLLRSNRESGPHTLNDLLKLGLKPYDLIWVEGRSAAWRYPSEVAELKEYAPIVEEQPYDRFYKKPVEAEEVKKSSAPVVEPVAVQQENEINVKHVIAEPQVKKEIEIVQPEVEKKIPVAPSYQPQLKKQVFVSMPESNGAEPYFQSSPNPYQDKKYEQYLPKSTQVEPPQRSIPVEKKSYVPVTSSEPDESRLETKYTQSLDDIKEMYVNTLVQRKTRNRRKEVFKKYVRPAMIPALLLIAGAAIGYVIKDKKSPVQPNQIVSTVPAQQALPLPQKEDTSIVENTVQPTLNQERPTESKDLVSNTENKTRNTPSVNEQVQEKPQKQNKNVPILTDDPTPAGKKVKETVVPDEEVVTTFQKKNTEVDPTTGERKKVVRDMDDEVVTNTKNAPANNGEQVGRKNKTQPVFLDDDRNDVDGDQKNIRNLVSVRSNNYVRGSFGGIRGLELTVTNNSGFLVDEVSVEVQIMKPSEQPLRTDIITFRNIAANGRVTVKVPDSQRGIRVDYRITNVESKQWLKSTAGL